ncbi:hypothetical protein [Fibrella forsythiae]|uniref:Uncharacterized protein n=1 Tax=Fibrella forsythiae TaxID=2817061 RepID=A0ABS3JMI4_9BACT|nr:hypothetical protein [Fibrella forsythiae]MBO0951195.1 hypothetical protein [Fibrella forsythiae]
MKILLAFALASAATTDQSVILIGAPVKRSLDQKDRVLTDTKFKAETGTEEINVTNPTGFTNPLTIAELQSFLSTIGGSVIAAKVSSDSLGQATASFVEKTYMPFEPVTVQNNLPAAQTLGTGDDAGKVIYTFAKPFQTASNRALLMTLKAGKTVCVQLEIEMNVVPRPVSLS